MRFGEAAQTLLRMTNKRPEASGFNVSMQSDGKKKPEVIVTLYHKRGERRVEVYRRYPTNEFDALAYRDFWYDMDGLLGGLKDAVARADAVDKVQVRTDAAS